MINHTRYKKQSRREVQRRFSPGTFVIDGWSKKLSLVVGWAPMRPHVGYDHVHRAKSWEAVTIRGERVDYVSWETMRELMTLEEWEDQ